MYVYYQGSDGSIKTLGDDELVHYNHNHDALGRFAGRSGGGSSSSQIGAEIGSKINKIDEKTGRLQRKERKYRVKASKYQRKANKVKRLAANPLIGLTDANRGANYAALRYEGKGLKYTNKADKINRKISKLDKKRTQLGKERVKLLEKQYPDVFEPGWRDKYDISSKDPTKNMTVEQEIKYYESLMKKKK